MLTYFIILSADGLKCDPDLMETSNQSSDSVFYAIICFILKHVYTALSINTDLTNKPTVLSQQAMGPVYDLGVDCYFFHSERKTERIGKMEWTLLPAPVQESE